MLVVLHCAERCQCIAVALLSCQSIQGRPGRCWHSQCYSSLVNIHTRLLRVRESASELLLPGCQTIKCHPGRHCWLCRGLVHMHTSALQVLKLLQYCWLDLLDRPQWGRTSR